MKLRLTLLTLATLFIIQASVMAGFPMRGCGQCHPGPCHREALRGCGVSHPGQCKTELAGRFKRVANTVAQVVAPVIMPVQQQRVVMVPGHHQGHLMHHGHHGQTEVPGLLRTPNLRPVHVPGAPVILVGTSISGNPVITTTPEGYVRGISTSMDNFDPKKGWPVYVQSPFATSGR